MLQVWLNTTDPAQGVTESEDAAEVLFPPHAQVRSRHRVKNLGYRVGVYY